MRQRLFAFSALVVCVVGLLAGCGTFSFSRDEFDPAAHSRRAVNPTAVTPAPHPAPPALKCELPMPVHPAIDFQVMRYSEKNHRSFQTQLDRATHYVAPAQDILARKGLPKELVYVALVESGFSPTAKSHANAVGMWQIISKTGARFGLEQNQYMDERRHPMKAARAAADYLSFLYDTFGDWPLALAAYNAGERTVQDAIDKSGLKDFWALADAGYLPAETRDYVPRVLAAVMIAGSPARYGFRFNPEHYVARHETVPIRGGVKLSWVGKQIGVSEESLQDSNPELCKPVTPPGCTDYELCVPVGTSEDLLTALANTPPQPEKTERKAVASAPPPAAAVYKVRQGDSWASLAAKHKCPVKALTALNGMKPSQPLRAGQSLKLPAGQSATPAVIAMTKAGKKSYAEAAPVSRKNTYAAAAPVAGKKKPGATGQKSVQYLVRPGDTLWTIAERFRIPVKTLCALNELKPGQKLMPGNQLTIYASQQETARTGKRKN